MPINRTYRLLCPIARALDKIGDRWTLLILRDLHAGPARFIDLQEGLTGLASNLLTSRLRQLQDDGLIQRKAGAHGAQLYELTSKGTATAPLLFELGNYGSQFPPTDDVRRPGNLRLIVVNLKESLRRRVAGTNISAHVELVIDEEFFAVRVADGGVTVRYEPDAGAPVSLSIDYEALVAAVDGRMSQKKFVGSHVKINRGSKKEVGVFFSLMGRAAEASA